MDFDNEFAVKAPIDEVWSTLLDVERVAPCVPGAEVIEQTGDDAYKVAIKVRLGPVSMQYKGDLEIVEKDESQHRAVMRVQAKEARGQGTANASAETRLSSEGGKTHGKIHTDLQVRGRAAAMGRGVMQDVSAKLVESFAANLGQMLEGGNGATPGGASADVAPSAAGEKASDDQAASIAQASPSGPPAETAAAEEKGPDEEELPLLPIVGSVAADRLKDPRVLLGIAGLVALIVFLIRR